jgi:hypothetical protein
MTSIPRIRILRHPTPAQKPAARKVEDELTNDAVPTEGSIDIDKVPDLVRPTAPFRNSVHPVRSIDIHGSFEVTNPRVFKAVGGVWAVIDPHCHDISISIRELVKPGFK